MSRIRLLSFALSVGRTTCAAVRRAAGGYGIMPIGSTRADARTVLPFAHRPLGQERLDRLFSLRFWLADHVELWLGLRIVCHPGALRVVFSCGMFNALRRERGARTV
jgi:hypothetical protein